MIFIVILGFLCRIFIIYIDHSDEELKKQDEEIKKEYEDLVNKEKKAECLPQELMVKKAKTVGALQKTPMKGSPLGPKQGSEISKANSLVKAVASPGPKKAVTVFHKKSPDKEEVQKAPGKLLKPF